MCVFQADRMPVSVGVSATALGIFTGLFPMGWVILTAVFFYNLTVEAGQFEVIILGIGPRRGAKVFGKTCQRLSLLALVIVVVWMQAYVVPSIVPQDIVATIRP